MKGDWMQKKMYAYVLIVAVVSFLGFAVENVWLFATKGYMDNRNMYFPFLLGYGLAVIGIFSVFGTPMVPRLLTFRIGLSSPLARMGVYFLLVMISVSVGEILLGTVVERLCHLHWWDYTRLPLHITRYTSIPTSVAFSLIITLFMRFCFYPLFGFFMSWEDTALKIVATTVGIIMMLDFVINFGGMIVKKATRRCWKIDFRANKSVFCSILAKQVR